MVTPPPALTFTGPTNTTVDACTFDDVDITNLTDGYVLAFNESTQKFEFVAQSGGGGGTIDTFARTRANTAFTQANSAFAQANTSNTLAQAAYNQANTGSGASESLNVVFNNNNASSYRMVALNANGETIFSHIPDWYEWQREMIRRQILNNQYDIRLEVDIDQLTSS